MLASTASPPCSGFLGSMVQSGTPALARTVHCDGWAGVRPSSRGPVRAFTRAAGMAPSAARNGTAAVIAGTLKRFPLCCSKIVMGTAMTPAQSRAARGLLDWSQMKLATAAKVGESTLRNFEAGRSIPMANNLDALCRALESAGVVFVEENGHGPGVSVRK